MALILLFIGDQLDAGNWIAIIDIIITSAIGIWIGYNVQVTLTTNRALKEHFVDEVKKINSDYNNFLNLLYQNSTTSRGVVEWFKIMTIKIETIQTVIASEITVKSSILTHHVKLKQFITRTNEFNGCYQSGNLILSPSTKTEILNIHRDLKYDFVQLVIDINKAKKSIFFMKKSIPAFLIVAIVVGLIVAGTNIFVTDQKERKRQALQTRQFESNLILQAIVPDNIQRSKKNLNLLIEAGFISKDNEIVKKIQSNDSLLNIRLRDRDIPDANVRNGTSQNAVSDSTKK